ncbi:MAG: ketopantoate reductase [Actinobacteria bacterium]|nr:ketopantoate reductase [Actinomycetota bacterium]MCG2798412.1 ketopantoate reductase [Cellulomonas sp.]
MRILMFGRGVVASVYGWAFARAGHDVEYYVRPGRAREYGDAVDLELTDLRRRPWAPVLRERSVTILREDLASDDGFDLVIVSVSHHRLAEAARLLAPSVGSATVLVLGNVWPEPAAAVAPLPADQVVLGFPGAGGGVQPDGTLRAGLTSSVRLGVTGGATRAREQAVRGLFRDAGFRVREESDLAGWLAVHFVADVGIHAQGLRLGTLSRLPGDTPALKEAMRTSRELLPVLEARGVDLGRHRAMTASFRHPGAAGTALAWITAHVAPARISMEAHVDPLAEEPRAVCRDALAEARRLGVPVPRLERVEALFAV